METDKLLGFPFHNYCVTTAENKYRIEEIVNAFALSEADAEKNDKKVEADTAQRPSYSGKKREQYIPEANSIWIILLRKKQMWWIAT